MSETIKPYGDDLPKKEQIRVMFDRISLRYDLLNRIMSFGIDVGWRRKTVRALGDFNPSTVLDVATGTGDLAIMAARKIPKARITGADLSEEMLNIARKKTARKQIKNIVSLVRAEAERLPFDDHSFDAVTVAFGVRNFEDISAGMNEIFRVLKSDGKVFVLEFGMPQDRFVGPFYLFYFRRLIPFIGGVVSGEMKAYRYLNRSVESFPYGERFIEIMKNCGFENSEQHPMTFGLSILYQGTKR